METALHAVSASPSIGVTAACRAAELLQRDDILQSSKLFKIAVEFLQFITLRAMNRIDRPDELLGFNVVDSRLYRFPFRAVGLKSCHSSPSRLGGVFWPVLSSKSGLIRCYWDPSILIFLPNSTIMSPLPFWMQTAFTFYPKCVGIIILRHISNPHLKQFVHCLVSKLLARTDRE